MKKNLPEIIKNEKNLRRLREKLLEFHPYDIAGIIPKLDSEERHKLYASLTNKELADIFSYLEGKTSANLFHELESKKGAAILEEMEVDDAVDLLQELDRDKARAYLNLVEDEVREDLRYLARQDITAVGSIMTTNFIKIEADSDVKEAMKILIQEAGETEMIDPLYITENDKLVGILDIKTLIIARSPQKVREIMKTNFVYVEKDEEIEEAAGKIRDYGLSALPVLDNGILVGIITIDDAMDVINDEAEFNYGSLAAVGGDIDERKNIFVSLKNRLPWLLGLLFLSFITSSVIGGFDDIIKQTTILVFFQSMVLDMVGNVSTQTLGVTISGIARGELDNKREIRTNISRELKISLINSVILAVIAFVVAFIFLLVKNHSMYVEIPLILSLAMFLSVNVASFIGVITPIIFQKIGFDPAVASGPLITTISDILGVLFYYGLATLLIKLSGGAL
ncbi:MAG TPA: magnesium transporter [Bacilli bacterium]